MGQASLWEKGAPINVNAAIATELDAISALAGHGFEIVRYREERGGFREPRQLDEVPGLPVKPMARQRH